jgi:hypothetical protein
MDFPTGPDQTSVTTIGYYITATGGTQDSGTLAVRLILAGPNATVSNSIESRISTTTVADRFEDFAQALAAELDAQPSSTVTLTKQYEGVANTDETTVTF